MLGEVGAYTMDKIPLATSSTFHSCEIFWTSVLLYHNRPELINTKLISTMPFLLFKVVTNVVNGSLRDVYARENLVYELRNYENDESFIKRIFEKIDNNPTITKSTWAEFNSSTDGIFVSMRGLFARINRSQSCRELAFLNKNANFATFHAVDESNQPIAAPNFPYHIELTSDGILRLIVDSYEDADTSSAEWLANKLFPQLLRWASQDSPPQSLTTLSLIDTLTYCETYDKLKDKYGTDLVKKWPEKADTDPQKYVYEDLAIAAYLICFWNKLKVTQNVNFVDCGCGNGLLVYILHCEGFKGIGLDVRSRKVWELYENTQTKLLIDTVWPDSVFPEATWIIGNHSDELTPWIPVIALKSSQKTNFFVLPCCPYDFNGRKYERNNTGVSQYADYLIYVEKISNLCGFNTSLDKLRIPSTKRTCLIGLREDKSNVVNNILEINEFIKSKMGETEIRIRESVERVRNCTQLDRALIDRILKKVIDFLLSEENFNEVTWNGQKWNQGACVQINDLVNKISSDDLKLLKNECGGLQTLLKNHSFIFLVSNGTVSLKKPQKRDESNKKYREKPCWSHKNHPNGCLYRLEDCAHNHNL